MSVQYPDSVTYSLKQVRNAKYRRVFYLVIDYVEDIYQTMVEAIKMKKLKDVIDEFKRQSPAPMNTMLTKQPRGKEEMLWSLPMFHLHEQT